MSPPQEITTPAEHRSSTVRLIFHFLVVNETRELLSPDFSLALRHHVGGVFHLREPIDSPKL
jgi:hypothetical protein